MFPYLVLTIFFIRGITLKGASAGLAHMYTPKVICAIISSIVRNAKATLLLRVSHPRTIFLLAGCSRTDRETVRTDGLARRGDAGFLQFRASVWLLDRVRLVQHPRQQLRAGRDPGQLL